jgi:hypothetical protein
MEVDQDEAMLHVQQLMTAVSQINELLPEHTEAIAGVMATAPLRTIWIEGLQRAQRAIEACIQRSKDILLQRLEAGDPAALATVRKDTTAYNRRTREIAAKVKRGQMTRDEARKLWEEIRGT